MNRENENVNSSGYVDDGEEIWNLDKHERNMKKKEKTSLRRKELLDEGMKILGLD